MCRRGLTLFLLPAVLLTQFVSMCRCTGGCGAASQEGRPHVHLNAAIPALPETKGCGCQRQRQATAPSAGQPTTRLFTCSVSQAPSEQAPCHGTDDHVLFLSFDAAHGWRSGGGDEVRAGGEYVHQLGVADARLGWPDHQCGRLAEWNYTSSPPRPSCPVYLRVRSLLI